MKKKLISMMLVSALAVSCLAGCGSSGNDSASSGTNDTAPAADSSSDSTGGVRRSKSAHRLQWMNLRQTMLL